MQVISQRLVPSVLIVLILTGNAWALLGQHEDWPFSSAPMFSHYVERGSQLYSVYFVEVDADGKERPLLTFKSFAWMMLPRGLFGPAYGSTDPRSPYGHHPNDTAAAFESRLVELMPRVARDAERHGILSKRAVSIRLVVDLASKDPSAWRRTRICEYALATQTFRMLREVRP